VSVFDTSSSTIARARSRRNAAHWDVCSSRREIAAGLFKRSSGIRKKKGGQPVKYDDYLQLIGWETVFDSLQREPARLVDAWLKMVTDGKRK
jgi:hypothetical protein